MSLGAPSTIGSAVTPADLEGASAILLEAAGWLVERGVPLWEPALLTPERLTPAFRRGEVFLARDGHGVLAGTFLLQEADELFWPEDPPGDALYLHKLAVRRSAAGTGFAAAMLQWACGEAARRGRRFLRLDCDANRLALCSFYEGAGFRAVDERQIGAFYARRFERVTAAPPP